MGSNHRGQLGLGLNTRVTNTPSKVDELGCIKVSRVRAGSFAAALSAEGQLYLWGSGVFGEFFTPHRVKSTT